METAQAFNPDWTSAPGETILDVLRERKLSEAEFANQIGKSLDFTKELLEGRKKITLSLARELEKALGASVEFWMLRDYQYQQDMARRQVAHENWLSQLPINDMVKFGWLRPTSNTSEKVDTCLSFFGVPSVRTWYEEYGDLQRIVAFRSSTSFDSRPGAVAAWVRQGEIEAEAISCHPWNLSKFSEMLPNLRTLTREKDPRRFFPELQKRCAECGVAVVAVRAPRGCRASGATQFLSETKALLQLSFRYLTDDHFWFTFFHEAGHLVLHGQKRLFLEMGDAPSNAEEEEANEFASQILIPPESRSALLSLPPSAREVIRFAVQLGISPGIVVGQLQHRRKIGYNQLNRLKRRFVWEE